MSQLGKSIQCFFELHSVVYYPSTLLSISAFLSTIRLCHIDHLLFAKWQYLVANKVQIQSRMGSPKYKPIVNHLIAEVAASVGKGKVFT
jgi:hypothetical protein